MKAKVNGETRDLPDGLTIAELLALVGAQRSGIAVARNDKVVRKAEYEQQTISDGDSIEIIKAVAGG